MTPSYLEGRTAFQEFVDQLRLPWRSTSVANLVALSAAFLSQRKFPLRQLARAVVGPLKEHRHWDKRFRRFLGNELLDLEGGAGAVLGFVIRRLGDTPFVPVMVDWMFIGKQFAVLWAQIPFFGRSFPILARVVAYEDNANTAVELALLESIRKIWPSEGPKPMFLADRGFPKQELFRWLEDHAWYYLVRLRQGLPGEHVPRTWRTDDVPLGQTKPYRNAVIFAGCNIRGSVVVATRCVNGKNGYPSRVRWMLATNLPEEFLGIAPAIYRHRMHPEETHRDCKRGHFLTGYALSHMVRLRIDRLERLLFCLSVQQAYLILIAETESGDRQWLKKRHWGLSLTTFGWELVRSLEGRLVEVTRKAMAIVCFRPAWVETGDS